MAKWVLASILLLIAGVAGFWYWLYQRNYPSTQDAYARAHIVQIAAQVSGLVEQVYVDDQQAVKSGEALFDIDPRKFRIALEQARAQLDKTRQELLAAEAAVNAAQSLVQARRAQWEDAKQHADRVLALVAKGDLPDSEGDKVRAALSTARADLAAARADLEKAKRQRGKSGANNARLRAALADVAQAQLDLKHTHITAPAAGILGNLTLRAGTIVDKDKPLFALVETGTWWVEANYKETELARIHPRQPATIQVDMYSDHIFHGVVESISPASGTAFSLLPPENATGNWVKVTQRFPVKIRITDAPDPDYPLRVGASSQVTVDTTARAAVDRR
jgi:membrane fusion protein (multidrug efflux system)